MHGSADDHQSAVVATRLGVSRDDLMQAAAVDEPQLTQVDDDEAGAGQRLVHSPIEPWRGDDVQLAMGMDPDGAATRLQVAAEMPRR